MLRWAVTITIEEGAAAFGIAKVDAAVGGLGRMHRMGRHAT
jgi:hypothetical protein